MKMKQTKFTGLLAISVLLIALLSCAWTTRAGEVQRDSRSIPLDGAESLSVALMMAGGQMDIRGGSEALLEAEFEYNVPGWEPMIDYSRSGTQGTLLIEQPEVQNLGFESYIYTWDLRFAPDVLLDMDINLGAGRSTLDLSQLAVTDLQLQVGAGDVELDLTGDRQNNLDGMIRGGVGRMTILLPEDIGVLVNVQGGVGSIDPGILTQTADGYVNEAYSAAGTNITLDIQGGVGEIELRVKR